MGFGGLALATAVAALGHGGLLVLLLHRRLDGIEGERLAIVFDEDSRRRGADGRRRLGHRLRDDRPGAGAADPAAGSRLAAAIGGGLAVLAVGGKIAADHRTRRRLAGPGITVREEHSASM